jgi:hypothetical protein
MSCNSRNKTYEIKIQGLASPANSAFTFELFHKGQKFLLTLNSKLTKI